MVTYIDRCGDTDIDDWSKVLEFFNNFIYILYLLWNIAVLIHYHRLDTVELKKKIAP